MNTPSTDMNLEAENNELRRRLAEAEQALQTLQQQEQLHQQLIDNLLLVVYVTDTDGTIRILNENFAQWAGQPREALVGKTQRELFPEALVNYWQQQADDVVRIKQPIEVEEQSPGTNGQLQIYYSRRFPLLNNEGKVCGVGGTAQDVTERKQAEAALRESQLLLNGIVDNSPSVIYVKSPNNQIMLVNQAYAYVVGRPIADIVGKYESDLFPKELVAAWRASDQQLFASGQPTQFTNTFVVDGDEHEFVTVQFPIFNDDKPFAICGISTDVTDLRRNERERTALQSQIIQAQEETLRELSTPLIPIADGVVIMPLIGSISEARSQQVVEALLEGVAGYAARTVIIDITGLPIVDSQVANGLLQATQAVQLLGAEVILTGIGPEVAQTLIGIGADLEGISTPGTLQNGVAYALQKRRKELVGD